MGTLPFFTLKREYENFREQTKNTLIEAIGSLEGGSSKAAVISYLTRELKKLEREENDGPEGN